eukprot:8005510-Pyramimonas_sp.AAC.1
MATCDSARNSTGAGDPAARLCELCARPRPQSPTQQGVRGQHWHRPTEPRHVVPNAQGTTISTTINIATIVVQK